MNVRVHGKLTSLSGQLSAQWQYITPHRPPPPTHPPNPFIIPDRFLIGIPDWSGTCDRSLRPSTAFRASQRRVQCSLIKKAPLSVSSLRENTRPTRCAALCLADLTSHVILGAGQLDLHRRAHLGRSLPFAAASSALGQAERTLR